MNFLINYKKKKQEKLKKILNKKSLNLFIYLCK